MALLGEVAAETDADVYGAQLARTKAAKIKSAQQLVEKASSDTKVIKGLLKSEGGRGKGKGRGKGRGRAKNSSPKNEEEEPNSLPSEKAPAADASGEEGVPGEKVAPKRMRKKTKASGHGGDSKDDSKDDSKGDSKDDSKDDSNRQVDDGSKDGQDEGKPLDANDLAKSLDLCKLWKEKDSRL
eukprot:s583_g37.t1